MKRIVAAAVAVVFAAVAALPLASAPAPTATAPATPAPVTATTTTAVQSCARIVQEDEAGWSESNPCASRLPAWYADCAATLPTDMCLAKVREGRAAAYGD